MTEQILERIDLSKEGSKVIVIGGFAKSWQSYQKYSQIEFWSGEQKDIKRILDDRSIPYGTKLLIISRFISHSELDKVMKPARDRGIPIIANKADGEISEILEALTKDLSLPIEDKFQRGKLQPLVKEIDFNLSNIDNARKLFALCKERNIKTTIESLGQFVSVQRRKQGRGTVPKSVRGKLDVTVDMFDSVIRELSGIRDYIIEINEENRLLKGKLEKYKTALKSIGD